MELSEEVALISRCKAGDKGAFSMLMEQYSHALFGTAFLMTRDKVLAEDAVQEALVQMWKRLPSLRLRNSLSLKAWLTRVVVNEVNQQRRKKRLPSVSLEQVSEMPDDQAKFDDTIVHNEEHKHLRQALEMLSADQREVLVLRYFSNLTVPEMAVVTGKREGTIKSRLNRAVERLGKILHNDELFKDRK